MKLPVLTAADGAGWEAGLVVALERGEHGVTVVRRCVDVVDLLAVAATGQARAALVSAGLRRLDADTVDRLVAAGVVAVGMVRRADAEGEDRLRALGVTHVVPDDAAPDVVASVITEAVRDDEAGIIPDDTRSRAFGNVTATGSIVSRSTGDFAAGQSGRRGSVLAVWGPAGAPGRTTVAVTLADELARSGATTVLIDADVYGGVIAATLGLLDESPGLVAACRQAATARFDAETLGALCWQLSPSLRVLTGIPRADRWPELRVGSLESVLAATRGLADFTVIDCGFNLEEDEELSFDTVAPRRNGVTLEILHRADVIIAVGAADPIGLQRLVRGLAQLRDAEVAPAIWVVLNKVRKTVVPGDPASELTAALDRFAGRRPAALLPHDQASLDAALAVGKTLGEIRPASPLRRSVTELATALAGVPAHGRRHRR